LNSLRKHRWAIGVVIALALGTSVFLWRASKATCWGLVGDVICRVETSQPVVALSFDDGPTPEGVDITLAELQRRNLRATFFLIGERMERWPGQAQRLAAAGMELGNHSFSHKRMVGHEEAHYDREIARTEALLRAAGAPPSRLFRPPFGRRLIGLPRSVERAGLRLVMWDVADDVAHHPTPQAYADDIISRARPGSIILIHPMYRTNPIERRALPLVLDELQAKGFRIVTVGELLALRDR
jgi:peptidoglycan/xylan/chitin deacetylase (PgdA/CDA1 family)